MHTRKPIVAGQFYPAGGEACLAEVQACIASATLPEQLPASIVAGVVPHAGWTFSGALAALVFSAIRHRRPGVATVVISGAAHGYLGAQPAVDDSDAWETPLGTVALDGPLRESLARQDVVTIDAPAHRREHSIEVQIPLIQHMLPEARILPVIVPPLETAVAFGAALAEAAAQTQTDAVYIGSSDLTHYGPRYAFTPQGVGAPGLRWAHEVNDRAFIDLALAVEPERLLAQAVENGSACGPGAVAATLAAVRRLGTKTGTLLAHTNSNEIMHRKMGMTSRDSVGYAALVF
ncbi:MAG: AmmeMemoRadiSam system protein B [Phycisphaerales bacterium]|nr:MAG: AmmeMemoRadiSam system protein B [Phycisphaerales bacterium]